MKVAFASSDGRVVDQQFRRASQLAVYEVATSGHRLDSLCAFSPERPGGTDERIRAIAGAAIVFVTAIGPSSAARLAQRGIRAATAPSGTPIAELLARVGPLPASSRECHAAATLACAGGTELR